MTSKLANLATMARQARHATYVWRLWVCALVLFLGQQMSPFLAPAVALLGLLVTWSGLHRHASKYESGVAGRSARLGTRWLGFASGLLVVCSFVTFGIETLDAAWSPDGSRLPAVVLAACLVGVWLAWTMVRNSWQVAFIVLGGGLTIVAGLAGFRLGPVAAPAVAGGGAAWLGTAMRLWIALLAAGAAEGLARRRLPKLLSPVRLLNLLNTTAFVMLLAYLAHVAGPLRLLAGVLAAAWTVRTVVGARFFLLSDWTWLRCWLRQGWSSAGPAPTGLFMALAFAPSLWAAAGGTWSAWSVLCGLALAGSILKILGDRLSRRRARGRAAPKTRSPATASARQETAR